jgi:hypothetical protein
MPLVLDFDRGGESTLVLNDGTDDGEKPSSTNPAGVWKSNFSQQIYIPLIIMILGLASWGFLDIFHRCLNGIRNVSTFPSLPSEYPPCWCGNSDQEAISIGCRYDHLAVDWLPDHCIDKELTAEFDRAGPGPNGSWPYFSDAEGSGIVNEDEIDSYASAGIDYFTVREWHVAHCIFTWRKQFRSKFTGTTIEPWSSSEEHIKHCGKALRGAIAAKKGLRVISTIIPGKNRHDRRILS